MMEHKQDKSFIRIENLTHTYHPELDEPVFSLNGINLTINEGDYIAVIGSNGSGKSTLLKHINGLILPTKGNVWVSEWNTRDTSSLKDIRSHIQMIFQVPETQIVATVVEEDVAFGPENIGVPHREIKERVDWALAIVGITDLSHRPTHLLSGGQKKLLAIASALAMRPSCLLFDESTSMLDPGARLRIIKLMNNLHNSGMTIVAATHNMEEAAGAQRIVVLNRGCIVTQGNPEYVFSQEAKINASNLTLPYPAHFAKRMAKSLKDFPLNVLTLNELLEALKLYLNKKGVNAGASE